MKSIIFITLALSVFDQQHKNDLNWLKFKNDFNKNYLNKNEEVKRYSIYKEKDDKIKEHNEKFKKGEVGYQMGHNQFSDMTEEELVKIYLHSMPMTQENFKPIVDNLTLPKGSDDVSYQKYCLPSLNQGGCGSCWAFAAAAQVEAMRSYKNGINEYISPQYVLDCSGAGTCGGGYPYMAISFMKENGGVLLNDYPYVGSDQICQASPKRRDLKIKSSVVEYPNGNEEYLKKFLANNGPVVIRMKIMNSFFSYSGGIYWDNSCPRNCNQGTDHAMLLVGYGTDYYDYWLVKNSWGSGWGESGYIRVIRNYNMCNIGCMIEFAEL